MTEYRTPRDVHDAAERHCTWKSPFARELAVAAFKAHAFEALWNRDRRTLARLQGVEPPEDDDLETHDTGDPGALTVPPLEDIDPDVAIPFGLPADAPVEVGDRVYLRDVAILGGEPSL